MKKQTKINGGVLLLLVGFGLFVMVLRASAQTPQNEVKQFETIEEAVAWLESRGLPARQLVLAVDPDARGESIQTTTPGCSFLSWDRNPDHSGPLGPNSFEVIKFEASFCSEQNAVYMTAGTDWYGHEGLPHRDWGIAILRDAETDIYITNFAWDISNIPDVDLEPLLINLPIHVFELGLNPVRIIAESNVLMEGGTTPAVKVVEMVITPNTGEVIVEKCGFTNSTFIFYEKPAQASDFKWLSTIHIGPEHIKDGCALLQFDNLTGPVEANEPNYRVVERTQTLPRGVWPMENGELVDGVWDIHVDATNQIIVINVTNVDYRIFMPLSNGGPGQPPECPINSVSVVVNGSYFRTDSLSLEGHPYTVPILGPEGDTLDFVFGEDAIPDKVELLRGDSAVPYAAWFFPQQLHFATSWFGGNEQDGVIGVNIDYTLRIEKSVNGKTCFCTELIFVDPP